MASSADTTPAAAVSAGQERLNRAAPTRGAPKQSCADTTVAAVMQRTDTLAIIRSSIVSSL